MGNQTAAHSTNPFIYKRVLLKISGESLMGKLAYGIDPEMVARVAEEVKAVTSQGVEVCLVIGGGNVIATNAGQIVQASGAAASLARRPRPACPRGAGPRS